MARVVVGLSGGVDSSVAAYLLKEQGHDVVGVFMQNWDPALNGDLADPFVDKEICQAQQDYEDAEAVAKKLRIEIYRVNFVKEYWDYVFTYFLDQYRKGRTPNPDIFCNKYIKFRAFLDYALSEFDCDYIAMGHYACVEHTPVVRLLTARDSNKDQTYFLEQLSCEQLGRVLFPLGSYLKSEVREIAESLGLVTAGKKDSTGICFIGERNFTSFLTSYIKEQSGDFVDIDSGVVVGCHRGMTHYTVGQRRGLDIGGLKQFANARWYVVGKNVTDNIVYVCQGDNHPKLVSNNCIVENINYINPTCDVIKSVKFRYRSDYEVVVDFEWLDDTTLHLFYKDAVAVTPGQACVFYCDDECLGGGEIRSVYYDKENRVYENSNFNS